jgi:Domain of unknown function (DUF5919)
VETLELVVLGGEPGQREGLELGEFGDRGIAAGQALPELFDFLSEAGDLSVARVGDLAGARACARRCSKSSLRWGVEGAGTGGPPPGTWAVRTTTCGPTRPATALPAALRRAAPSLSASTPAAAASRATCGSTCWATPASRSGILVYAALFLAEDASVRKVLAEQARAGVRVRLLLGDPGSPAVAQRGEEEGIGPGAIGAKIRNVLALFLPVLRVGAEIRLHDTVPYNSMYRADDDLLVNAHIHGYVATCAPVLRLRKIAGGSQVATYLDSFGRIWDEATPWTGS